MEEILTNKGISYGKFKNELGKPKLDVNEEKQRPEIQFWADVSGDEDKFETWKLFIIEISVPFGRGDQEDEHSNTLKKVIEFKTNKYAPLIKSIITQFRSRKLGKRKFVVEFIPFVISSLGALPNKSVNSFSRMLGSTTKNTVGLWCKKLVVKALKGSSMIWVKANPKTLVSNNRKKEKAVSDYEEIIDEERDIAEEVIESVDEERKLGSIYDNEGDAERKKLIQELEEEKERMNELNLPQEAIDDNMDDEIFEIYNHKVMNQEEVADYGEVQQEEAHLIERPNQNEIVIVMKPSEHPLFSEEEDNNFGDDEP
jgi:hypothetical protein